VYLSDGLTFDEIQQNQPIHIYQQHPFGKQITIKVSFWAKKESLSNIIAQNP